MPRKQDPILFEYSPPAEPGNVLFCHEQFLEKLEANRNSRIGKRVAFLLQRLIVDESRVPFKATQGANRGWRRSRLGGSGGNQFYAWWAPQGAPPVKDAGLDGGPAGAIFLRDIRHHDDHSELPAQTPREYVTLSVRDLRQDDYAPSPLTSAQAKFAGARWRVRVLHGFPGSGKTTALLEAAEAACSSSALYVTYSKDLAALAGAHFRRLAPRNKHFHVVTFSQLVRDLLGVWPPEEPERERRRRFAQQVGGFSPRILGPWFGNRGALYDEIHAHMLGRALPEAVGRFARSERLRVPERDYREARRRWVGGAGADAANEAFNSLASREGPEFLNRFFPELSLAWRAASELSARGAPQSLRGFDTIAVDEVQDLTPLEAFVIAKLAASNKGCSVLAAGDEAQTVRPTDFEWGWFHDLLYELYGRPEDYGLGANLRSPRRIAEVVNAVTGLYAHVAKEERPAGSAVAEIDDDAGDLVTYCTAQPGPALNDLLAALADRENHAVICLDEQVPNYVPEAIRHKILTVFEAKGLDFRSVTILDLGRHLARILSSDDRVRRDERVVPLTRRLAIDQLRVAVSRPSEKLVIVDVAPDKDARMVSLTLLHDGADDSHPVLPVVPEVVLHSLDEDALEPEERVRLCERDAVQMLDAKPELAWSRARQAIALLGTPGRPNAVDDDSIRRSACMTLARVAFTLAFRNIRLPEQLEAPDLWEEALNAIEAGGRADLTSAVEAVRFLMRPSPEPRVLKIFAIMHHLAHAQAAPVPWLRTELGTRAGEWIAELEAAAGNPDLARAAVAGLIAAYEIFDVPDRAARIAPLRDRAIAALMDGAQYENALYLLQRGAPRPKLLARCYEGLGRHKEAADLFHELGMAKDALRNFRAIPDLDAALALARVGEQTPAAEALAWMAELRATLAKRPANFARVATAAEKRWVQDLLEANLEGPRRTPVKKRAPRKKKAAAGGQK